MHKRVRPLGFALALLGVCTLAHDQRGPRAADAPARAGAASLPHPDEALPSTLAPLVREVPATPAARGVRSGYFADRVLVRIDRDAVHQVAARHGLEILKSPRRTDIASLAVPEGRSLASVLATLRLDPDVRDAFPAGRIQGAGGDQAPRTLRDFQWYRQASELRETGAPDPSGFVVAVLDTGVAYEDWSDDVGTYRVAPSLATTPVVAPIDLVHDDEHANDDHQHGTHIASVILSDGDIQGVAAGATLMPIKVLDATNSGDELALIEGIHHAVDHGADVINMSLSFGLDYQPSPSLLEAVARAVEEGVILVAAAGNGGADRVTWPAAHPSVIAVGSITTADDNQHPQVPTYSNLGAVDLLAPGGDMGVDLNEDGYDDGVLAETFALGSPTELGYWFYAGTSQAAAVVSGAALQLLATGATPGQVGPALQAAATDSHLDWVPFEDGVGAGVLDLDRALEDVENDKVPPPSHLHVSVLPYLASHHDGDEVEPKARFVVVDDEGAPVNGVKVHGQVRGSTTARFHCKTDGDGRCSAKLNKVDAVVDGVAVPLAWAWEVETTTVDRVGSHPGGLLFASEALEVVTAALETDGSVRDAALAVFWPAGEDDELGDLVASYTVPNLGTGLLSSPLGLVFTASALDTHPPSPVDLDLDGTGLLSSPLGLLTVQRIDLDLDGSGLLSSPLGFRAQLVAIDGTGLLSSPLGFSGRSMFEPMAGSGLLSSPLGFWGAPIRLNGGVSASLEGSSLGDRLGAGGWMLGGTSAASALVATGFMNAFPAMSDVPAASGLDGSSAGGMGGQALTLEDVVE